MKITTAKLGYLAAGLTVLAALLTPFLLMNTFSNGFIRLGLHVDEVFSGGPIVRTVPAKGYSIDIHRPVYPHLLQKETPFVQLAWKPASALPNHISDTVDIDGDGQPDVRAVFNVEKDAKAPLYVTLEPLTPRYQAMKNAGKESFSKMIARVDDAILVRVPLNEKETQ